MSSEQTTLDRIQAALDGIEHEISEPRDGMPCVETDRGSLHDVLARLRDGAGFETITFVTGIDRLGSEPTEPRFEVVHQLHAPASTDRVRIRTKVTSDDASVPSCVDLWPGAGFMERECWDMLGIRFDGNPNLKRLLMPEGYEHHPLRKEFPSQGIEPDRLYRQWDEARRREIEAENQERGRS